MYRLALLLFGVIQAWPQEPANDPVLRAMRDELARARTLRLPGVETPYYVEYALDDINAFSASATQGALLFSSHNRSRVPRVQVRVGDYSFDQTNYAFVDFFQNRAAGRLALDDNYTAMRYSFWLAADRSFKGAAESISRKRSALRNITQQEKLNDFARAEPVVYHRPPTTAGRDEALLSRLVRELSAVFARYPKITSSQVELEHSFATTYFLNSEGTEFRYPDDLFYVRARAAGQAKDGMPVRDAAVFQARSFNRLAPESQMRLGMEELAGNITALIEAPVGEDYSGPVLVEGMAAPQLFAQLLGTNLAPTRRPVSEPGRQVPLIASELEGRMGSRILPEWMDAADDPSQTEYRGQELQGHYPVDAEGVIPKPLTVIEKGVVKNFLLSRLPVRGYEGSNGRARLPGPYGSNAAVFSNLFVRARETMTGEALKKKLLEMAAQRGKPYAMILRKLDFPTASSGEEIRRLSLASGQRGGSVRPVSIPVLAYRVHPDGREELVRGLRFRGLNVRTLRDIVAAADAEVIFHFTGNGSPLPAIGSGGYVALHTVVAPPVLFEDLELEKREDDWPRLPVVPPPALLTSR